MRPRSARSGMRSSGSSPSKPAATPPTCRLSAPAAHSSHAPRHRPQVREYRYCRRAVQPAERRSPHALHRLLPAPWHGHGVITRRDHERGLDDAHGRYGGLRVREMGDAMRRRRRVPMQARRVGAWLAHAPSHRCVHTTAYTACRVSSDSRGPGALIRRDTWRFPAARGERRGGMDWFSSRAPYLVLQCNEIFTTRLSTLCPVRRVYMSVSMYRGRVHGPEHEAWPLSSQP